MSTPVPSTEPTAARAGDSWRWSRSLADYPASGWQLTYTLYAASAAEPISFDAVPDGTSHLIALAPADTQEIPAGDYSWVATVSDGTDRHAVGTGGLQVLPDLANLGGVDGRSHARRMLSAIESLLEGRASAAELDLVQAAFADMNVERNPDLLHKLRARYQSEVAAEQAAMARARGEQPANFVQLRF